MANVHFRLTSGEQALLNEIKKSQREVDKLKNKLDQTGKAGAGSFKKNGDSLKDVTKGFKNVISSLIGPVSVAGAITAVIAGIRQLYVETKQLNRETAQKTITTAQARAAALVNLSDFGGGGKAGARRLDEIVDKIQKTVGGNKNEIYQDAGALLSKLGSGGEAEFISALRESTRISQLTGGIVQGGELSGAALRLAPITGSKNAKANLGRMFEVQAALPGKDPVNLPKLLPSVKAMVGKGFSEERAQELLATFANVLEDYDLSQTATAGTGFAASLSGLPLYPTKKTDKSGKTKTEFGLIPGANIEEKFTNLKKIYQSSDIETQTAIKKAMAGRTQVKETVIDAMLRDDEKFLKEQRAVERKIKPFSEKTATIAYDQYVKSATTGNLGRTLQPDIAGRAMVDVTAVERGTTYDAQRRTFMDNYYKILRNRTGAGSWFTGTDEMIRDFSDYMSPGSDLRQLLSQIQFSQTISPVQAARSPDVDKKIYEAFSKYPEQATKMIEQINRLLSMLEKQGNTQTTAAEKMNQAAEKMENAAGQNSASRSNGGFNSREVR